MTMVLFQQALPVLKTECNVQPATRRSGKLPYTCPQRLNQPNVQRFS